MEWVIILTEHLVDPLATHWYNDKNSRGDIIDECPLFVSCVVFLVFKKEKQQIIPIKY